MSTSPYSKDLRERVIKFVSSGNTQKSAALLFSLNLSTVNRWYLRYRREGNYLVKKRPWAKSKINDKSLAEYVSANEEKRDVYQELSWLFSYIYV
jgi:transposase